jgi:hypothetical protein
MKIPELFNTKDLAEANKNIRKIIDEDSVNGLDSLRLTELVYNLKELANKYENNEITLIEIIQLHKLNLEKIFAVVEIFRFIPENDFKKIKKILPENFFFYGLLINAEKRGKIDELKDIHPFLINKKEINIYNYSIEKTGINGEYKGLIKQKLETKRPIKGSLVGIKEDANWYKLFKELDEFEEVGVLYDRCIELLDGNNYAWVYMKRKEEA